MRRAIELPDVHDVVFVFENGCFAVIDGMVIRRIESEYGASTNLLYTSR